jgi:hypothetical protein
MDIWECMILFVEIVIIYIAWNYKIFPYLKQSIKKWEREIITSIPSRTEGWKNE